MFVYLFSLLLAASPWSGVWQITAETLEGGVETYYLVIQSEDSAQLYDHQWYPQGVKTFEIDENTIKMGITFEGVVVPTLLEGQRDGARLNGTVFFYFPQYEIKSKTSAQRILEKPIRPPAKQVPEVIEGRTINIVQYLAENAPKGSLDEFIKFWQDDVVPRYFVLMDPFLPKTDEAVERSLKVIHESLEKLEQKASEQLASDPGNDTDYTVLVPAAEDREPLTIEVYSERKEWPPDYKPCCGEKLFNIKKFRLVTVAP